MEKAILTLPMMPVDGTNYGKYVTPIVCETLRNIYNGKYYHCINILDSFNDRNKKLDPYLSSLINNNIKYDYLWYDNNNIDQCLNNINLLIKNDFINELETDIYTCECGIVEIEENKIKSCNPQNLKFEYKNNEMYCKYCKSKCNKYKEKVLIFTPKNVKREQIQLLPEYLNKDAKTYEDTIINSYTTISRKRRTGIVMKYNETNYNIDVDFLWATYLSNFSEQEKIVVSGNRMTYQLFLTGVIEKCLNPTNNTILLGTPYITDIKSITNNENFIDDAIFRKLTILLNLKWAKKERNYDATIMQYLKSLSPEKRRQLYDIINKSAESFDSFYDKTKEILKNNMNMQTCIKTLKKERR